MSGSSERSPHPRIPTMRTRSILILALATTSSLFLTPDADAWLLLDDGPIDGVAAQPASFANCTQCHASNALNSGNGSFAISGVPSVYAPSTVYPVTVTLQDPGQEIWGFELTALDASGANAGQLASSDGRTQTSTDFQGRSYVKQTRTGNFSGTLNGPVTWSFNWTSPASGTARFYAAGNAGNDNGSTTGDFIYSAATASSDGSVSTTLVLQPDTATPRRGSLWNVRARVRNHSGAAASMAVVSRVNLGGGQFFPAAGWLLAPVPVSLAAGAQADEILAHPIPISAPLVTASYEGYVGIAPSTLLASDSFAFSVTP